MTDLTNVSSTTKPLARCRTALAGSGAALAAIGLTATATAATLRSPAHARPHVPTSPDVTARRTSTVSTITTRDGTSVHYKDWGTGQPVVLSHGWPLSSDSWESQALHLASNGFRVVAHDRRGHGRSSQPWHGNDMDTYADDLAELIETLELRDIILVGFSTGGGEITRYVGRHGTARVAKIALISAVPPLMLKTAANPGGLPIETFDALRAASIEDRSKLYRDLASGPFFGFNRPGAKVSQGMIDSFWLQGMMSGHKNAYDCIKAFSEERQRVDSFHGRCPCTAELVELAPQRLAEGFGHLATARVPRA